MKSTSLHTRISFWVHLMKMRLTYAKMNCLLLWASFSMLGMSVGCTSNFSQNEHKKFKFCTLIEDYLVPKDARLQIYKIYCISLVVVVV